jgi:predicted nucleic acid-binding protein
MRVVVDSNILIANGLWDEPLHTQAKGVLAQWRQAGVDLSAPMLFRSEVAAVVRKAVFQKRITHAHGRRLLTGVLAYAIDYYEDDALLEEAYELAARYNRPRAYDTQYLALAERLACDFWTADERMFNALQGQFPRIHWLGNWQANI